MPDVLRDEAHTFAKVLEVLAFIRNFDRINRPKIEANRIAHWPNVPICRLTNDSEVRVFLASHGNDT
ncbi:MAG: hypothetical protein ABSA49_06765 [Rhizomicrobium sp.]|jgi:hypothetical protein